LKRSGIALLLLLAAPAAAGTIVVDPDGGGDVRTLQAGVDAAAPGDTVLALPGYYCENLRLGPRVHLSSRDGAAATILDAEGGRGLDCVGCPEGTVVEGFTIRGGGGQFAGGMMLYGNSHVEIRDNVFSGNVVEHSGAGITVQYFSSAHIHDNLFVGNRAPEAAAIVVVVSSRARIANNVFRENESTLRSACVGVNRGWIVVEGNVFVDNRSFTGGAVHACRPATHAEILGNTFVGNRTSHGARGATCIRAYLDAEVVVAKNIFAYNDTGPAVIAETPSFRLEGNVFWENEEDLVGDWLRFWTDGNRIEDPRLCDPRDPAAGLAADSPCLIAGAGPRPGCPQPRGGPGVR